MRRALRTVVNPSPRTVFPWKMRTKMWWDQISESVIPLGGAESNIQFRANSIYDPSGTGSNSYGYNDAVGIYAYYRVTSAKLIINLANKNTTDVICWMYATWTSTVYTYANAKSLPTFREVILGDDQGGDGHKTISLPVRAKDMYDYNLGVNSNLGSAFGTNPTQIYYITFGFRAMDTASAVDILGRYKLWQTVIMSELRAFTA